MQRAPLSLWLRIGTEEITKAPGKEEVEQFLELTQDQEY